ncbi:hypothetical protein CDAR_8431 [Caerostris darwini]|uniref:Uncharacterized protein n=1 Tax=Caerostris darwini TaxID=1538125 RepID=A0AAV4WSQ7_9ARAC|nr:hypothetical protein CDAR_8431 [Caerostris darwini]
MASCPARQITAIKRGQSMSEDEASFMCDYSRLSLAETVFSMANRRPPKSLGQIKKKQKFLSSVAKMASCPARQISAIKSRQSMSEDEASFTCDYSRLSLAETVFLMAYHRSPKLLGQVVI